MAGQLNLSKESTIAIAADVEKAGGAEPALVVVFDKNGKAHDFLTYGEKTGDPKPAPVKVKVLDFSIAVGIRNPVCCYYWISNGEWKEYCWC